MGGDERIRLFCALRLPGEVLDALVAWQRDALDVREGVRFAPRENLHVTLAFFGSRTVPELEVIVRELRAAARETAADTFGVRDYRETLRVGMLRLRNRLADDDPTRGPRVLWWNLYDRFARLGIDTHQRRVWVPHVTVLRFREPPRLLPRLPEIAPFSPSDAAVYRSVLRPSGAQYEVLETVALGGSQSGS